MHFYFTWYLTQSKALRRCSVNPSYPLYAISMVAWAGGLAESAFIFYPMELITQCVAIFKLHFYNTATTGPFYLTYVGEHSFWISIQAAWIGRKQLSFRIWNCDICGIFCVSQWQAIPSHPKDEIRKEPGITDSPTVLLFLPHLPSGWLLPTA